MDHKRFDYIVQDSASPAAPGRGGWKRHRSDREWLFVGSSPSAPDFFCGLCADRKLKTITCNGGIHLCVNPDVYVIVDQVACPRHRGHARQARRAHGTHLVTLRRTEGALRERGVEGFDEFLAQGTGQNGAVERHAYGAYEFTGPLCLEYACRNGAGIVHVIGFDGYRNSNDYFYSGKYEETRPGEELSVTEKRQARVTARLQEIAEVWSDVQFIQYGDPTFEINSPNWEVAGR